MEMYAGRVACCRLVSQVEYVPRFIRHRQTDGHQTITLRLPLNATSVIMALSFIAKVHLMNADCAPGDANPQTKSGVLKSQVKLCDQCLSALDVVTTMRYTN